MNNTDQELVELIKPLFDDFGLDLKASSSDQIAHFEHEAIKNGVSLKAIDELKAFYRISDGIDPSLDGLWICQSEDMTMYEYWQDQDQLWIGQRDMDLLSFKNDQFHLGCAGKLNYREEYIFETLLELLQKGFKDWYPATNGKYPISY